MRTPPCFLISLIVVYCFLFCVSCADDNDDNNDENGFDDYVHLGKTALADNDATTAANAFHQALAINPDSTEAKFGLVLSHVILFPNIIDDVLETISGLNFVEEGVDPEKNTASFYPKPEGEHTNQIHGFFQDQVAGQTAEAEALYEELAAGPDFDFELAQYNYRIGESDLFVFGGSFDQTDLHFFGALNALVNGICNFVFAHNLYFDFTVLILPETDDDMNILIIIDAAIDMIDSLLSSTFYPDFLYLMEDGGVEHMQALGIDLGNVFARFYYALDNLQYESGDQTDDQIGYIDSDNNGAYDPDLDSVFIGQTITIEPELAIAITNLADKLAQAFYEGSSMDVDPYVEQLLSLADFSELLIALGILPIELGPIVIDELPEYIAFNLGTVFADPSPDGLRSLLEALVALWKNPEELLDDLSE